MRNRLRKMSMNTVLSALLLASGVVPPGIQHAHAGGSDATHRHDGFHDAIFHASHSQESNNEHHVDAARADASLLADCVLHLHWQILGMEFSIPVPEAPSDGNHDSSAVLPAVVRAMKEIMPATQTGPSFGGVVLSGDLRLDTAVVSNLSTIPRLPNLATSIPLCDSARLERSGVLLA